MLVHRLNTSILFVQQALRISFARTLVRICLIVVFVYPSHICVYFVLRSYHHKTGRRYIMRCHGSRYSACAFFLHYLFVLHACWASSAGKRTHVRPGDHVFVIFSDSKNTHIMRSNNSRKRFIFFVPLVSTQPHNHLSVGSHVWINCYSFCVDWYIFLCMHRTYGTRFVTAHNG